MNSFLTNFNGGGQSLEETVNWYNERGGTSENRLKELKLGLGMARMPCGDFRANAVFFWIGVIAYNLFKLFDFGMLDFVDKEMGIGYYL